MKRGLFAFIREIIEDYPNYEKYIKQREDEIMYRHQEFVDENIGGGKAQNVRDESNEYIVISLSDDKRLNSLKRNYEAVHDCLKNTDEYTQGIIYELYIAENRLYTLNGIADKIGYSRNQVMRKRDAFFEAVAEELGLL
ncbi:transcriptional regulator [Ligilactobacillus salitolerans]|uniref:Transcriptional regulator n=1 Tax=Ligilactobacillus salitolerans TaxID=1808352 RepID=A0A401ISY4_9LACO|nr:transcriptional regulator [Ligilactobacillus salitolerans]GBG94634.1 transcriptional regulator [Ligilactobacillus salitolerans]